MTIFSMVHSKEIIGVQEEYSNLYIFAQGICLWAFFCGEKMKLLNTIDLKNQIINELKNYDFENKIIILSKKPSPEVDQYKKAIIKRCEDFSIKYIDKIFSDESNEEVLSFINSFDKEDGFIILSPFGDEKDLDILKKEIKLKDLDSFTYKSLGQAMEGIFNGLPATARAIARFLDTMFETYRGKTITIANASNIIGKPLAVYLSSRGANIKILNSSIKNPKTTIKNSDIFISAIGKANYYDKSYFKDDMVLIDVGTSYINGKIVGDIDMESIKDMDLSYLAHKDGIGSITTITLVEGLKY